MKAIHALSIALLLGLAAALGAVAATRTATATTASPAAASSAAASPTASIHNRQVKLARWQHQLQRALAHRLPKLPKLVRFPLVPVAAHSAAPVYVAQATSAPAQRTVYVHAKAPPGSGHARGREHEGAGAYSQGDSHDD